MGFSPKQKDAIIRFTEKHGTMPSPSKNDSVTPKQKKLTPEQIRQLNKKGAEIAAALKNTV